MNNQSLGTDYPPPRQVGDKKIRHNELRSAAQHQAYLIRGACLGQDTRPHKPQGPQTPRYACSALCAPARAERQEAHAVVLGAGAIQKQGCPGLATIDTILASHFVKGIETSPLAFKATQEVFSCLLSWGPHKQQQLAQSDKATRQDHVSQTRGLGLCVGQPRVPAQPSPAQPWGSQAFIAPPPPYYIQGYTVSYTHGELSTT